MKIRTHFLQKAKGKRTVKFLDLLSYDPGLTSIYLVFSILRLFRVFLVTCRGEIYISVYYTTFLDKVTSKSKFAFSRYLQAFFKILTLIINVVAIRKPVVRNLTVFKKYFSPPLDWVGKLAPFF